MQDNHVITFGCRLNTYESAVIKDLATQAGLENAVIVNTCAVTAEAERQAKQTIRKLRRKHPNASIIVTGCAAQINPDQFSSMPEVTCVIGNHEKMNPESYQKIITSDHNRIMVNDIMAVQETASHLVSGFEGKSRAFVQIQNGCNHRCTFCTIPFGRGNSRSVALGEIVQQISHLISSGYQEIVLTGVDITDYGLDLPGQPRLGQMIKRLLVLIPDLKRLRLSSLDPVEIDSELLTLIQHEPRILPHLHLSLQAGHDLILKRMKRRHLRHDVIDFCKQVRQKRPDVVFGADIIVGFPTEKEEHFQQTLNIVDECDLTFLHVFPYSPRPGTPAARMPQVEPHIIKERAHTLRQKGQQALQKYFDQMQGKNIEVLIESVNEGIAKGKNEHFAPVLMTTKNELAHTVVKANVRGKTIDYLVASPCV